MGEFELKVGKVYKYCTARQAITRRSTCTSNANTGGRLAIDRTPAAAGSSGLRSDAEKFFRYYFCRAFSFKAA